MNTQIVPFGKHKGKPVEALLQDPQYTEWLSQQSWVKDKHPQLYTLIINNFGEPNETPEHNAMQATLSYRSGDKKEIQPWDRFLVAHVGEPKFEVMNTDVEFEVYGPPIERGATLTIELKPVMSDNYPAVLRQALRIPNHCRVGYSKRVVVANEFTSQSVTLSQVKQIFLRSGVTLLMNEDITSRSGVIDKLHVQYISEAIREILPS